MLTTDVNNRAYSVVDLRFDQTFWSRGKFPNYYVNGTETLPLTNPWYSSPSQNAPFDQCEPVHLWTLGIADI